MKKFFSLSDLVFLIPVLVTVVLTAVVDTTSNETAAMINMGLMAFGYELIYYIYKMFMPGRFTFFDLLKLFVTIIIVYSIYTVPFIFTGSADTDLRDILMIIGAMSCAVLVIGGPLMMLMKKLKNGRESQEED